MNLIKLTTQSYPYTVSELRKDYPNVSFPSDLAELDLTEFDCAEVRIDAPPPHSQDTQTIESLPPSLIEGVWTVQWSVRDLSAEEIKERAPVNWPGFNFWLFTNQSFISYGLAANSVNPYLVPAIIERYGQIAKAGLIESGFPDYWNNFCQSLGVSQEHRDEWAIAAEDSNLPSDFITVIRGGTV